MGAFVSNGKSAGAQVWPVCHEKCLLLRNDDDRIIIIIIIILLIVRPLAQNDLAPFAGLLLAA